MDFVAGLVREKIILIIPKTRLRVEGKRLSFIASQVSAKDEC